MSELAQLRPCLLAQLQTQLRVSGIHLLIWLQYKIQYKRWAAKLSGARGGEGPSGLPDALRTSPQAA